MAEIDIPPTALEAAATALHDTAGTADWDSMWDEMARAACIAMLQSWPGMVYHPSVMLTKTWRDPGKIILPLPQESTNAET